MNDLTRASLDIEEAEILLEKTKKEKYNELVNKYLDYEKYLQEYKSSYASLNLYSKRYRLSQNKYDEGLITIEELNSSELEKDYSYITYLQSISNVNLSKLSFYFILK